MRSTLETGTGRVKQGLRAAALCWIIPVIAAAAHPAGAQENKRIQIALMPRAGWFIPGTELGSVGDIDNPTRTTATSARSYSFTVEVHQTGSTFGFRLSGDYVPESDIERAGQPTGGSARLLAVAADVVIPTYGDAFTGLLNLSLFAGAGIKRYEFTTGPAAVPQFSGTHTTSTVHLGVDLLIALKQFALALEAFTYPSWFNADDRELAVGGQFQNDLFVQGGIRIPVR